MIFLKMFLAFLKIGAFSFGGGYAMLPLLQEEIIENHQWLTGGEFTDIVAIAQMTPGPIAINSATFIGFKISGFWGALTATVAVVTPSLIIVLLICFFLKRFKDSQYIAWGFKGIRPVVLGLIASAAVFVAQDAFIDIKSVIIAIGIIYIIGYKKLHPILGIVIAAVAGIVLY